MRKLRFRVNFTKLVNGGTRIRRQDSRPKPILQKQLRFKNTALLVVRGGDFAGERQKSFL